MGNSNFLGEKLSCQDISRDEYYNYRSKVWNFQENYLYQTEIEQVDGDSLKVITYEINTSDREYEIYFQKLNMMSKYLNKGNIHLPLLCISENRDQCNCSPHNKESVKVPLDQTSFITKPMILVRAQYRENFNQKEVWYILYNTINALRQYEPFYEPSGNLSPKEILMNSRGEIKLKTALTSPFQHSRKSVYVNCFAPEQLSLIRKVFGQEAALTRDLYKDYQVNPNISQVYALGLIIVAIITGRPHLYFYDPPLNLHTAHLQTAVQQIQSMGYSRTLLNLLKIMLTSYQNRPLPSQIHQVFRPFEQEIIHFEPFSLSLAQSEVHSIL